MKYPSLIWSINSKNKTYRRRMEVCMSLLSFILASRKRNSIQFMASNIIEENYLHRGTQNLAIEEPVSKGTVMYRCIFLAVPALATGLEIWLYGQGNRAHHKSCLRIYV